jgi:pyridoxal/pyridoxine/pyridoxamine kinase
MDPVMGDNGDFYVPKSLIPVYQKEMLSLATVITPNHFEAGYFLPS